jgi:hypothetical protein
MQTRESWVGKADEMLGAKIVLAVAVLNLLFLFTELTFNVASFLFG